jgi:hypothetical protein
MEASMPAFFAEALISFSREKDALPKGVISSPRAYTLPDNIGTGSFAERAKVQRCQIHKRRNVKGALAEARPGGYGPQNPQRLCDDRVHGGESGAGKDFPATRAHESQRGM